MKFTKQLGACSLSLGILATASCIRDASTPNAPAVAQKFSWPSAYPTSASLNGLNRVALRVYADRGIPSLPDQPSVVNLAEQLVRQQLETEGIIVVGEEDSPAILDVNMYLVCESDGLACGYHTSLALRQMLKLERKPSVQVAAITWRNSYTNAISKAEVQTLPDLLMVDLGSLLNGFTAQFREANPN